MSASSSSTFTEAARPRTSFTVASTRRTALVTAAIALLRVVLEDADLRALAVLDDLGLHGSALHNGGAEGGLVAVQDSQHLIELHGVAGLVVQLLDEDHVALGDLVLLSAGLNDCVHLCFNSFNTGSLSGAARKGALMPIQSGSFSIPGKTAVVKRESPLFLTIFQKSAPTGRKTGQSSAESACAKGRTTRPSFSSAAPKSKYSSA